MCLVSLGNSKMGHTGWDRGDDGRKRGLRGILVLEHVKPCEYQGKDECHVSLDREREDLLCSFQFLLWRKRIQLDDYETHNRIYEPQKPPKLPRCQ